jgi:hypothetical protein
MKITKNARTSLLFPKGKLKGNEMTADQVSRENGSFWIDFQRNKSDFLSSLFVNKIGLN